MSVHTERTLAAIHRDGKELAAYLEKDEWRLLASLSKRTLIEIALHLGSGKGESKEIPPEELADQGLSGIYRAFAFILDKGYLEQRFSKS